MPNVANYIQVSETVIDHPKTTRAIRLLRMNRMQFVGHLVALWNWALKNAADGDLSRFSARDIADAARFTDADDFDAKADEDARRFVEALIECSTSEDGHGFLEREDGHLYIHDWQDYGGKLLEKRQNNARRKQEQRMSQGQTPQVTLNEPEENALSQGCHADVTRMSHGTPIGEERRGEERRGHNTPVAPNGKTVVSVESGDVFSPSPTVHKPAEIDLAAILADRPHWAQYLRENRPAPRAGQISGEGWDRWKVCEWLNGKSEPPVDYAKSIKRRSAEERARIDEEAHQKYLRWKKSVEDGTNCPWKNQDSPHSAELTENAGTQ